MKRFSTPDEVEAVFYEAFKRCDAQVMASLWADEDVVYIHPGSRAILNRDAIVRSWESILGHSDAADLIYTPARRWQSGDLAVHVVAEQLNGPDNDAVVVLATNVYRRFEHGWLMVEHHASLLEQPERSGSLQ